MPENCVDERFDRAIQHVHARVVTDGDRRINLRTTQ
jgi:hypothetical protein